VVTYRIVDLPSSHVTHSSWRIMSNGVVLWQALVEDGQGGHKECLFQEAAPPLALACEGDEVAEPSGATFSRIDQFIRKGIVLAVDGAVDLAAGGGERDGIWFGTPGNLEAYVLEGDEIPGLPGSYWEDFDKLWLNRRGMVCFSTSSAPLTPFELPDHMFWCGTPPAAPSLLARIGDQAAGRPPGETVVDFEIYSGWALVDARLDDTGRSYFQMETTGGFGLFLMSPGLSYDLAFEGESSPVAGLVYSGFDGDLIGSQPNPAVQNGMLAYTARVGVDKDDIMTAAVFSRAGTGVAEVVAKTGDPLPGGATMGYTGIFAADGRGNVAWEDNATYGEDLALYSKIGAVVEKRLGIGDPATGAQSATDVFKEFNRISMNNAGQVILHADIGTPGSSGSDSESLWVLDPVSGPVFIAEEYGQINFSGSIRTTQVVSYLGGDYYGGDWSSYNESSQLVFRTRTSTDPMTFGFVVVRVMPASFVFDEGFDRGDLSGWSSHTPQ
jgi:hypothetical protein